MFSELSWKYSQARKGQQRIVVKTGIAWTTFTLAVQNLVGQREDEPPFLSPKDRRHKAVESLANFDRESSLLF
jgi:hypothetical protein